MYQSDFVEFIPKRSHNFKQFMKQLLKLGYNDCNEWTIYKREPFKDDPSNIEILNELEYKCLCKKTITNMYYIFNNNDNSKFIRCGSTCVKEFMGIYILHDICLRCDAVIKRKHDTHHCKDCRKYDNLKKRIIKNKNFKKQLLKKAEWIAWSLQADREIEAEKQARELEKERIRQMIEGNYCLKCKYFINNKTYKICYTCNHKKCGSCGKNNIKIGSNYKVCYKCNQNKIYKSA